MAVLYDDDIFNMTEVGDVIPGKVDISSIQWCGPGIKKDHACILSEVGGVVVFSHVAVVKDDSKELTPATPFTVVDLKVDTLDSGVIVVVRSRRWQV